MHKTWADHARTAALALLCATAAQQAAAVNKCTAADGQVVYQDAPCSAAYADARRLKIEPAPPVPSVPPQARPAGLPAAPVIAAVAPPAPAPQAAEPPARSLLDAEADACLDWYRPMLRDPRSAYWRDAYYVQGTLNITVVATNGYGGFVNTPAACDFRQGAIDAGWTKTQAKRREWAV